MIKSGCEREKYVSFVCQGISLNLRGRNQNYRIYLTT